MTHLAYWRALLHQHVQQVPVITTKGSLVLQEQPDDLTREKIRTPPPG
ncbi:hypothetical protein ACFSC4_27625 [Deinococcus malanensis]|nr:hypothetical protein [Deinococcus malanensis]